MDRWEITITNRSDEWCEVVVEDFDGVVLAQVAAPLVSGATFDTRAATIRAAIEDALTAEREI